MATVAVVTGCSRGIGFALVSELTSNNYKVFATCRSPSAAAQLTTLLKSLGQPEPVRLDVTDEPSLQEAYKVIRAKTDHIDLLINNAGTATKDHPSDPSVTADPAEMTRLFATNVAGVVRTTQVFLPLLRASRRPRVVNVSSNLASITRCLVSNPGVNAGRLISYRASKAALNMATVTMSQEVPEVEFVLVHPGWVHTDMGSAGNRCAELTPQQSAAALVRVAMHEQRRTGVFLDWNGQPIPW